MFPYNIKPESDALNVFFDGLDHLYSDVKASEQERIEKDPNSIRMMMCSFGSDDPKHLILNHFVWYANSLWPFMLLFERAYKADGVLRTNFAPVVKWRHKVAAHPSLAWARKDSKYVQGASVNQFIAWDFGRYSVGREVVSNPDTGESTPGDWGWELTEVHERLVGILKGYL